MARTHSRLPILFLTVLATALAPDTAMAHPGHDLAGSWTAGFNHPLLGWDHLLAMVAVGLWAAQQKGASRWALPLAFVTVMVGGGFAGWTGAAIPFAEEIIGVSVVALSLFAILRTQVGVGVGTAVAALFAFFHGFAHGAEMPASVATWAFGFGFVTATALLHGAGFVIGTTARKLAEKSLRRQPSAEIG